jgi:hypothetical protein
MHHTISDGWSLALLFRELQTFYEAALTGSKAELPNCPCNMEISLIGSAMS